MSVCPSLCSHEAAVRPPVSQTSLSRVLAICKGKVMVTHTQRQVELSLQSSSSTVVLFTAHSDGARLEQNALFVFITLI